jgi:pilus assembly protein CpaB
LLSARRLKFLSLALLMSGATVVLTQQWLAGAVRKAQADARASAPSAVAPARHVLVAKGPIPAGTILKPEQLRWQSWPADTPTGAYLTEASTRIDQLNGAVVRTALAAGEPLSASRVAYPGDRSFLAAVLRPGYRAVTVNVSPASGVAGFVLPGDHVDLILSRTLDQAAGQKHFVSETVLTDVRVVGMDQRASDVNDPKKDVIVPQTATLEVTPKGAEVIAVVSELGRLSLSLRSLAAPETPAVEARVVTRTSDHEAIQAPVAAARAAAPRQTAPAAPRPDTVEVVRGSAISVSQMPARDAFHVERAPGGGFNMTRLSGASQ